MKIALVCAALVLTVSSAALAHEKKKAPVTVNACAGLSIKAAKAAKLDCGATGTVATPHTDTKANPEPRLGYDTNPFPASFGL
ncbi:hypothetical protein FJW08_21330 [Mesorhizobium sp. B3-2-1]|uniref:hypothetical protein n=1 Tax=Mesorhizobium sp. B3-2-1 TaxID=2589891 RepID=UPI00112B02B7|nr:hypothetical protein [Mesorhizobium sp. B3-2-1]TPI28318.1 hypothetical protein FJW08_21330 [Mesorhizobium sp. B3-2-1]